METNSGRKFIPSLRIIVVFIKPKSATYQRKKKKNQANLSGKVEFFFFFFKKKKRVQRGG